MKITIIAASVLALATAAPAIAQDTDGPGQAAATAGPMDPAELGRDRITIVGGVATIPSYEGADKNRVAPAAFVNGTFGGGYGFWSRGYQLYLDVIKTAPGPVVDIQAGPIVGVNFNRSSRKSINDDVVERLGDLKTGIDLGGFVGIGKTGVITSPYDKVTVSLQYVHDVNNASDSYVISPILDYTTPLSRKAFVGLSAQANYAGNGYADYYFSVTPLGTARSGLPTFNAGKGWKDAQFTGFFNYSLTGDLLHGLGLVVGGRYSRLFNDFKDSPIVSLRGDRDQWYGAAGLSYTF